MRSLNPGKKLHKPGFAIPKFLNTKITKKNNKIYSIKIFYIVLFINTLKYFYSTIW
jgi:hypothetical protein